MKIQTGANIKCRNCGHSNANMDIILEYKTRDEIYKVGCLQCKEIFGELEFCSDDYCLYYHSYETQETQRWGFYVISC